jgi:hypothetical protein
VKRLPQPGDPAFPNRGPGVLQQRADDFVGHREQAERDEDPRFRVRIAL